MYLHDDLEEFHTIVVTTAQSLHIPEEMVEKDYYLTLVLKELQKYESDNFKLLFKGGTSLSKCYHIINRFSEDIDLTWNGEFSKGTRNKIKKYLSEICDKLGIELLNPNNIWPEKDIMHYKIKYQHTTQISDTKEDLLIETSFFVRAYPAVELNIVSMIGDYLIHNGNEEMAVEYGLSPFSISVQRIDRTLIDKIFAVCDYYLLSNFNKNSRHLYDIKMIVDSNLVTFDDNFKKLFREVRNERLKGTSKNTVTADSTFNVTQILTEIVETRAFEDDYQRNTLTLIGDHKTYDFAISGIQTIIDSGILNE